jgi:hypothetical protein
MPAEPAALVNRSVEKRLAQTSKFRGLMMKKLFGGLAMAAIVMLAMSAWAQGVTTKGESTRENAPGTAGTSKAGVPGLPGSKSGPTLTPSGKTVPEATRERPSGDQSGVRGLPGSKSGATIPPPNPNR